MISKIVAFKFRVRSLMCWMLYILCIISGYLFIYKLLIDVQAVEHLYQLGVPLNIALFSGIIGIMCEYRPTNTPEQIRYDNKVMDTGLICMILLSVLDVVAVFATSPHS